MYILKMYMSVFVITVIDYVTVLFDHWHNLPPQFEKCHDAITAVTLKKCCDLIGLPKFQPSSWNVVQTLQQVHILKEIMPCTEEGLACETI